MDHSACVLAMGNGLSFRVTERERERVAAAALAGLRLDPRGAADAALVVALAAVYGVTLAAAIYALCNRNYPPIRCKAPVLMACIPVAGTVWLAGDTQANGHVPLRGTALENCKAFGLWMRIVFGALTVSALWAARVYGIYRVFALKRPFDGRGLRVAAGAYLAGLLVFGAVVQATAAHKTLFYLDEADICAVSRGLLAAVFAVIWANFAAVFVLSWLVRNVRSAFNEAREMAVACLVVLVVLVCETVMHYASPHYPLTARCRLFVTYACHIGTAVYWWLLMAEPLVNCAFRRERYLARWTARLVSDGLELQYDMSCDKGHDPSAVCGSSAFLGLSTQNDLAGLAHCAEKRSSSIVTLSRCAPDRSSPIGLHFAMASRPKPCSFW
ncbi:hypothetical protein H4R18_005120 [Coemansia javaensis]|uniref:G-protein coupled receptors family 3 profile domain-containing protein n=1 Tax=Coemansia javaensis TaxID=2761396 RepID=A0A9W8H716_9FUNG|nr:hypothetical protein H4R18_005120 [Coemansia javaensis]